VAHADTGTSPAPDAGHPPKEAKTEKVAFELARLMAWKFGAKTEAMSAEQRRLFEETLAEHEASLLAQLQQAKAHTRERMAARAAQEAALHLMSVSTRRSVCSCRARRALVQCRRGK
jgi:hypothetical protein